MNGRSIPITVGDIELLVETVSMGGVEQTSALGQTSQRVVDVFEQSQAAIVEMACSVAHTVSRVAARAVAPDRLEVEFGLKFTAKGGVIIAGTETEGALRVLIGYDSARSRRISATET